MKGCEQVLLSGNPDFHCLFRKRRIIAIPENPPQHLVMPMKALKWTHGQPGFSFFFFSHLVTGFPDGDFHENQS